MTLIPITFVPKETKKIYLKNQFPRRLVSIVTARSRASSSGQYKIVCTDRELCINDCTRGAGEPLLRGFPGMSHCPF